MQCMYNKVKYASDYFIQWGLYGRGYVVTVTIVYLWFWLYALSFPQDIFYLNKKTSIAAVKLTIDVLFLKVCFKAECYSVFLNLNFFSSQLSSRPMFLRWVYTINIATAIENINSIGSRSSTQYTECM